MEEESRGAVLHMSSEDGRRLCITGMSLVDPAYVRGERVVNVWAEVGQEKRAIGTLSSREPVVSVPPVVLGGEFVLRHDLAVAAAVRLNVRVLGPPESSDVEEVEAVLVLGVDDVEEVVEEDEEEEDEAAVAVEYEPMSEEDVAEHYDSDNGEGGEDFGGISVRESRKRLVAAPAGSVVPDGEFLGPARFAVVGNTAGFMRIAAAAEATGGDQESKEILVLYRYTRFSRTQSARRGVEACRRTKLHRLHFAVPPAASDLASSLAWAGSSLGPLIYPGLFHQQLADLWMSLLLATPAANAIPPGVGRLQVIVDVGILRREDYTLERMAHMRGELVSQVLEPWSAYYHVVMELHLPEPVPANRRIAADDEEEEECCVCFEVLESGLAAWPGCGHVFHGACVKKTLERSEMCPLCRHRLSDPLVAKNIKIDPLSAV
ncbi:unnamed protein product [Miscanthus lutarioriparius]|uniref:RING-type domain-containing protein n=1 Tax=Miscanthus lutarioriparius TaxID=422564 RepID=A0A811PHK1_9POAL|nr:unnamed protein product [Miscanthus lutarioriparius]